MNNNIANYISSIRRLHRFRRIRPQSRFKNASDFFNRDNIALAAEKLVSVSSRKCSANACSGLQACTCTCVFSQERKKSSRSRGREVQKEADAVNAYDVILRFAEIRRVSNIETCISAGKHLFNSRYSRSLSIRPESRPTTIPIPPLSHLSSYSAGLRLFDISRERASQRRATTGEMQFDRRRCTCAPARVLMWWCRLMDWKRSCFQYACIRDHSGLDQSAGEWSLRFASNHRSGPHAMPPRKINLDSNLHLILVLQLCSMIKRHIPWYARIKQPFRWTNNTRYV